MVVAKPVSSAVRAHRCPEADRSGGTGPVSSVTLTAGFSSSLLVAVIGDAWQHRARLVLDISAEASTAGLCEGRRRRQCQADAQHQACKQPNTHLRAPLRRTEDGGQRWRPQVSWRSVLQSGAQVNWVTDRHEVIGTLFLPSHRGSLCRRGDRSALVPSFVSLRSVSMRQRRERHSGMSDTHKAIEAMWKIESTRLIAGIARVTRDIGIAEELAQDALVAALERWPDEGIPEKPAAWLMTAAKRRAIDALRRGRMLELKHGEIARELEFQQQRLGEAMDQALDQVIDDDVLRLIFTACHPVLAVEGRVALTLRLACGLTTAEIARSFLVPEKTLGQRIFRAKKTLSEAHVPFETPRGDELRTRVQSVLSVVYLIFNEGYTATSGEEWMRAALCDDALRLGRMLAELLPAEPEVHGLLALMELQASRNAARRGPTGEAILFPEQDRSLWDYAQIQRGLTALNRAQTAGRRRPQLRPAGGDRCVSRASQHRSGDRLGAHRASL